MHHVQFMNKNHKINQGRTISVHLCRPSIQLFNSGKNQLVMAKDNSPVAHFDGHIINALFLE
jgi:hypothetical protein